MFVVQMIPDIKVPSLKIQELKDPLSKDLYLCFRPNSRNSWRLGKISFKTKESQQNKNEWNARNHISTVVGVIDYYHFEVKRPIFSSYEYVNTKVKITPNVPANCNVQEQFTSIDAQWPGR